MKTTLSSLLIVVAFTIIGCQEAPSSTPPAETPEATATETESAEAPNSYVSLFEIPVTDMSRAIGFYEAVLDLEIEAMEMPGMEMGILPYENQLVNAVLMKGEDYQPSADGITIYLNAGQDLQPILDRVESNGGQVLVPKTAHADESGFFALFLDSEGNRLGLNSVE